MASGQSFNIIEKHIEKVVLGLLAIYLIFVILGNIGGNPHPITKDFKIGENGVSPGEVGQSIRARAETLDKKLKNTKPDEVYKPKYEKEVKKMQARKGIYAPKSQEILAYRRADNPFF